MGTGCEVYGQYVDATGSLVGANFPIQVGGAGSVSEASILGLAYSPEADRFLVTWTDAQIGCCRIVGQLIGTAVPPVAKAGPGQSIHAGETVVLDGSGSFDDDRATENLIFAWVLTSKPEGSTATLAGGDTATPTFVVDVAAGSAPARDSVGSGELDMAIDV